MKKKVAIFANGWSNDFVENTVDGITKSAMGSNVDLFLFLSFCAYSESETHNLGESNIFKCPDFGRFDGVILLPGTFNVDYEFDYVLDEIRKADLLVVTIEYKIDDIVNVCTDTYSGMCELVEHVYKEHNVSNVMYLGGFADHDDTKNRLRAVQDVSKKYGINLSDDNILFADWAKTLAMRKFHDWRLAHDNSLPEVVFCANDIMARGIVEYLEMYGFSVPKDMLVTGYDCTKIGQQKNPSLATVRHDYKSMGYAAMNILDDMMNGIERRESVVIDSQVVLGETCGCGQDMDLYNSIKIEIEHLEIDGLALDSHFRHMYVYIRKVNDIESFSERFGKLFEEEHWIEGDDLMICVEPEFFELDNGKQNLRMRGYNDKSYLICDIFEGKQRECRLEERQKIIFGKSEERDEPGLYIFVPIHSDGKAYGFSMLTCGIGRLENNYLYIWTRHIDQILEQVYRNLEIENLTKKLTAVSVTDMLTGVYNRTGCEQLMYPMLYDNNAKGKSSVMMMIDVDRLKYINDVYGHGAGDIAIKSVADAVRKVMPSGFMIARFGGDEFLVVGECDDNEQIKAYIREIEDILLEETEKGNLEFVLTASIGYTIVSAGEKVDINKCIRKADEYMYAMKKRHHDNR